MLYDSQNRNLLNKMLKGTFLPKYDPLNNWNVIFIDYELNKKIILPFGRRLGRFFS